jgi:histone deacetylase complex subunit SAP30
VDFSKLDMAALKRYKRTFKLRTRHNSTKVELIAAITKHFTTLHVNEVEIIEAFLETMNSNNEGNLHDQLTKGAITDLLAYFHNFSCI